LEKLVGLEKRGVGTVGVSEEIGDRKRKEERKRT
jgi:hypothetical protein